MFLYPNQLLIQFNKKFKLIYSNLMCKQKKTCMFLCSATALTNLHFLFQKNATWLLFRRYFYDFIMGDAVFFLKNNSTKKDFKTAYKSCISVIERMLKSCRNIKKFVFVVFPIMHTLHYIDKSLKR